MSATERLLKAILLIALACYVVSLILGDWRGALGSAVLGLVTGVVLVEKKLRELERRLRVLEGALGFAVFGLVTGVVLVENKHRGLERRLRELESKIRGEIEELLKEPERGA